MNKIGKNIDSHAWTHWVVAAATVGGFWAAFEIVKTILAGGAK